MAQNPLFGAQPFEELVSVFELFVNYFFGALTGCYIGHRTDQRAGANESDIVGGFLPRTGEEGPRKATLKVEVPPP